MTRSVLYLAILIILIRCIPGYSQQLQGQEKEYWHGFEILDSSLKGHSCKIVFPEKANENRDWIWRARFWGHEPQTDIALLEMGFHLAYIDVGGLFGNEEAIELWDTFYPQMIEKYQLNPKVVLEGLSRGGLILYNWANRNAEKVACIYADAPVCDFKSWPMGSGIGSGSEQAWLSCLSEYGFTEDQALAFKGNPVDHMENLARAKIPILHVVGDSDKVVPVSENTASLKARLIDLGWDMKVLHKPGVGHHPHSLEDPKPIVDFILINTGNREVPISEEPQWSRNNTTLRSEFRNCKMHFEQEKEGHVAFLGGSITEMEGYRPMLCAYLESSFPSTHFTFTNAGIASTGSTTGAFRMERDVLSKGTLDLLFVEFAVNDDQDSEDSYIEAQLGMEAIIRKARSYNPSVDIVMTYFVNPHILENYQRGIVTTSIAAHDEIAKYYGISTCNLAREVADQITVGTLDWESFGGTHPKEYGNAICSGMITSMLEKAWSGKEVFNTPTPLLESNFEKGRLVDPRNCNYSGDWLWSIPNWEKLEGEKRERFLDLPMLWTTKKGAELSLEFTGTAVGVYVISGPDAGMAEVRIDKRPPETVDLYHHKYSRGLHYPQTIMFASDLEEGNHTLELKMLKERSGSGNALRIMYFVENGL